MSRPRTIAVLPLIAVLLTASSALALEKTSRRVIEPAGAWDASSSTTLRYYNICTGWVWVWTGWSDGETMGTSFDSGYGYGVLNLSWALTFSGVPSGYGFTGTISVNTGNGCGPVLASQPYLPPVSAGYTPTLWGGLFVPSLFSINIAWGAASGITNPTGLASDHPFAGPTGPQSCGTCFPTTRVTHSRYYGVGGAYCPSGTTLNDGVCDIEWVIFATTTFVDALVDDSWSKVKGLYR